MMIVTTNLDDGDDKPRVCLVSESDCPKICHCLDLKVWICRTRRISIFYFRRTFGYFSFFTAVLLTLHPLQTFPKVSRMFSSF